MEKKIFFWMILFIIASCGKKGADNEYGRIHLEKGHKNKEVRYLSEVASDIEFIFLETNDDCLLADIYRVLYESPYYYIMDLKQKSLLIFDDSGKFVNKISAVGQGPGEYVEIWDYDVYDKLVYIYDMGQKKLLTYGTDGKFIKDLELQESVFRMKINNENEILFATSNLLLTSNENNVFSLYDKNFELSKKFKQMELTDNKVWSLVASFYKQRDTLVYFEENIFDTIYNVILPEGRTEMRYIIDPGGIKSSLVNKSDDYMTKDGEFGIGRIVETNDFVFLYSVISKEPTFLLYYKNGNQTIGLVRGFMNDMDGGPNFWPGFKFGDNKVGDSLFPHELKAFLKKEAIEYHNNFNFHTYRPKLDYDVEKHKKLLEQLEKTDDMSNPIIRVVTMK